MFVTIIESHVVARFHGLRRHCPAVWRCRCAGEGIYKLNYKLKKLNKLEIFFVRYIYVFTSLEICFGDYHIFYFIALYY